MYTAVAGMVYGSCGCGTTDRDRNQVSRGESYIARNVTNVSSTQPVVAQASLVPYRTQLTPVYIQVAGPLNSISQRLMDMFTIHVTVVRRSSLILEQINSSKVLYLLLHNRP